MSPTDDIFANIDLEVLRKNLQARYDAMTPEQQAKDDADHKEYEAKRERAKDPTADDYLTLVKVHVGRWSVDQWWLLKNRDDWREAVSEYAASSVTKASLKAAIRGAWARRQNKTDTILNASVHMEYAFAANGSDLGTIRQAMANEQGFGMKYRGEPRMIGYNYTGSRAKRGV